MNTHSIRRIIFGLACGLSVTVLCRSSQATTTFADGTFSNSTWTDTLISAAGSGTFTSNLDSAGIPPPSRRTHHSYPSGSFIRVAHMQNGALYYPSSGAFTTLNYSYNLIYYPPPASRTAGSVRYALLLLQNGSYYEGPPDFISATSWTRFPATGSKSVTSAMFHRLTGTGPEFPDFSCTGAPIQLGYLTGNSSNPGSPAEFTESGIDNWSVSIDERPCCGTPTTPPCCGQVRNAHILCPASQGGGLVFSFDVTNTSGQPAQDLLLAPPVGSSFTVSPNVVPGPFPNLQSTTVNLTVGGPTSPGQALCVDVKLTNPDSAQCCSLRACAPVPACDCLQVRRGSVACSGSGYNYTFSLANLTGQSVTDVFVLPESPAGLTVAPQLFPFSSSGQTLAIGGATAGQTVCFRLAPRDQCCSSEQCLTLPVCIP